MISKNMEKKMNDQINKEIYSGYLYLSMASYAASKGLMGFANWFKVQLQEEVVHAQMFYDYVLQQGGRVILDAIDKPPSDFKGPRDLFQKTLEHERGVTKRINALMELARKERDHATETFLQWFITEQVEEEANPSEILQKLDMIGAQGEGILMIDSQLAGRVFTPPQTGGSQKN